MRHVALHGPIHHHRLHERVVEAGKLIHQPAFWVAVGVLLIIVVVVALTLIRGVPSQPSAWDSYLWMPY